jgi:hypothetical protein
MNSNYIIQFYCKSEIEGNFYCDTQCLHCKKYYKPLEDKNK